MQRNAFTVVELLILIAALAVLAALLAPAFRQGTPYPNRRRSVCRSNLKQIGLAFAQYFADYERNPPAQNAGGGWTKLLAPHVQNDAIFQCPEARGTRGTDYFYNARWAGTRKIMKPDPLHELSVVILSGDGADSQEAFYNLAQLPAAWRTNERSPASRHLSGANYLFADGHVKAFNPDKITLDSPAKNQPTFLVK